ncbi:hypothetical protein JOQ06_007106 [Pogonophryne albipinna]|uniref:BTB domain-containing protein n=1 Tax=Pogonophryne albipinna TaxID=1090488 RepID=A0AAD6B101_9TELE|nr:hypothetical protein JOQ06_007106 [Pogonophryne albipinna]
MGDLGLASAQAEHGSLLLRQLERMRAAEELTDVVLLAEGIPFTCHKVVLSAFSPYFQAMFTCGLKETRGGEVFLRDTPAQSLELLLDYMYRAELRLSDDNIQGVAAAAFLLHVDGAFRLCQNHMEACMDPSNCIGLYHWARDLGAAGLANCALRYLCQHFAQVCEEEEVLELDAQSLGDLLGSDDLNILQEEVVLELVLRWVERRRGDLQSEAQAVELIRRVRLELVDPQFLRKTRRRNPELLRDAECFGMIDAALQTPGLCEASAAPRPALRYGMETTDLLLCLGGVDKEGVPARRGGLADLSFCFDPHGRKTYFIPSPLRVCGGMGQITAGAVTRDNNIVVAIEGEDQHRSKRVDIYRYDQSEKNTCHCTVSLKERLYVLGGWTPQHQPDDEPDKLSNRVFRFDPGKDRWTECARMKYSRYRCGTAVLNGEMYILGGIGCDGDTVLALLQTNASNVGAVHGKLYLCGYYKGAGRHEIITKEILKMDPADNVWTVVERRAALHDSYDVCLVVNLNPRDLFTP